MVKNHTLQNFHFIPTTSDLLRLIFPRKLAISALSNQFSVRCAYIFINIHKMDPIVKRFKKGEIRKKNFAYPMKTS